MKPILIIDPGHGGKDPGAVANGILEKDYTLKISQYQYDRFKALGVPVMLTRDTDVFIDSTPRANLVKNSGAKYCISNHINAAGNTAARGAETIHSIFSDGKLAHALFRAVVDEGMPGRRMFCREGEKKLVDAQGRPILKDGKEQYVLNGLDYYFMHRQTGSVETIIVEYGFATNTEDSALIQTNWQRYAEAVVRGFCQFIGHLYSLPEIEQGPSYDVSDWAEKYWKQAIKDGVIDGTRPKDYATREELITILYRMKGD